MRPLFITRPIQHSQLTPADYDKSRALVKEVTPICKVYSQVILAEEWQAASVQTGVFLQFSLLYPAGLVLNDIFSIFSTSATFFRILSSGLGSRREVTLIL